MTSVKHVGKHCGFFFKGIGYSLATAGCGFGESIRVLTKAAPDHMVCVGVAGAPAMKKQQRDTYELTDEMTDKAKEYFSRTFSHCP